MSSSLTLVENASATGDGIVWRGGQGLMVAEASAFGTVKLQFKSPQGTWVDVGDDVTFTASGMGRFYLPPGQIRANIDGATAAYAWVWGFGVG